VFIVEPNWGDARQWNQDFTGKDVDAMDPDKIARMLKNVVKKPDMSKITGEQVEDMRSAVVQELVDAIMQESGMMEEEQETEE